MADKLTTQIGILGGGQLGRMLLQAALNYDVEIHILDKDDSAPAAQLCTRFHAGSLLDYDTVVEFGKGMDVISIEIENVNVDALAELKAMGKVVIPDPEALRIIQDKGVQDQFYQDLGIPTAPFALLKDKTDIPKNLALLPGFQKLRKFGYDGRGVQFLENPDQLDLAFDEPSVLEKAVDIDKELSVIVAVDQQGNMKVFPPVELVFNPKYNLVDHLVSPANLTEDQASTAIEIALKVAKGLKSPGLFAVEQFLDRTGHILVNETAPRTHNSGHQSIEGNFTSQFEQQLRILLDLPMGSTELIMPSIMINLIGEPGFTGPAKVEGLEEAVAMEGVYVHLYGKKETRPGRKMGHVTIIGQDDLLQKARKIQETLKIIS